MHAEAFSLLNIEGYNFRRLFLVVDVNSSFVRPNEPAIVRDRKSALELSRGLLRLNDKRINGRMRRCLQINPF